MGKDLESTMKWKVDISQFKSAITEANNSIKLANSEFKKASAGMDDWTKSEEGLAAKMRQLTSVADAQQRKVDVLRQQYEETAKAQGEDSEAAQKLKIQLNNQEAALESTKKEMRKYTEGVDDAEEETKQTTQSFSAMKVAIGNLIADGIKKLISQLGKLKEAYQDYDAGADLIITKTGATGEKLAQLSDSYDKVQHSVLASSEDIGTAIGEVNTRFGYTGEELESLTEKFLKFAQINGTDVNSSIDSVQKTLAAFGLSGEDAGRVLDALTLTGQRTGVSVDKLTDGLLKNATAFQQMGLSLEDAIVLMGQAEMSGADMEVIMNGVGKALKVATEEGRPLSDVLAEIEDEIKYNKNETEALALAYEYFGKSGDKVFSAIKSGTLTFRGLQGSAEDATGAVEKTYEATMDGADEMKLILQGIKADIGKDIANFLDENKHAIKSFIEGVIQFIKNVVRFIKDNSTVVLAALGAIGSAIALTFAVNKISAFATAIKSVFSLIAAHPFAALAVGVGVAIAALAQFIPNAHEAAEELYGLTDEQKEYNNAIMEQADAWKATADARAEAFSGIDSEIEHSQKLWEELQGIVDENGRVKEGYEDRAAVITGILSKALGMEIDLTNGQITNYKELKSTIQDVIEIKKAEAYLAADEQAYAEAIKGRKDAYEDLAQARRNASVAEGQLAAAEAEAEKIRAEYETAGVTRRRMMLSQMVEAEAKVDVLTDAYNEQNETLLAAQERYDGYMTTIQNHEGLMEAIETGEVEPMTEAMIKLGESYGTAETMSEEALKKQESYLKQKISDMRADIANGGKTWTEEQLAVYEAMYSQTQTELDKLEQAHAEGGREAPRQYVKGYEETMPAAVEKAGWFAGQIKGEMDSVGTGAYTSGQNAGTWFTEGLNSGIGMKSGNLFQTIRNLGMQMLNTMKLSLQEQSPSKATRQMGEYLMEGLGLGMKAGSKAVLSQAGAFGDTLISSLQRNVNGSLTGLMASGQAAGGTGNVTFIQNNNSPKALDALTIYRQTNSILFRARVQGNA